MLNEKHVFGDQVVRVMLTKESLTGGDVKKVHLGRLDSDITAEQIHEVFSQFGVVLDVHTPKDAKTGERRNYGFVTFSSAESYNAAVARGFVVIGRCNVSVKPASQTKDESA